MAQRKRDTRTGWLFPPPRDRSSRSATSPAAIEAVAATREAAVQTQLADHVRRSRIALRSRKADADCVAHLAELVVVERFRIVSALVVANPGKRPYARFVVGDRTGTIPLFHWCPNGLEEAQSVVAAFPPGTIAIVSGRFERERYGRCIVVDPAVCERLTPCRPGDYDPRDFAMTDRR